MAVFPHAAYGWKVRVDLEKSLLAVHELLQQGRIPWRSWLGLSGLASRLAMLGESESPAGRIQASTWMLQPLMIKTQESELIYANMQQAEMAQVMNKDDGFPHLYCAWMFFLGCP